MKLALLSALIAALFFLQGCTVTSGLTNQFTTHGANTNVVLDEANFTVIGTLIGQASGTTILGFGGGTDLVAQARNDLYTKAELNGKSRALTNLTLERHVNYFLFGRSTTITVSGVLVEFVE
jgi:hypothetical protein